MTTKANSIKTFSAVEIASLLQDDFLNLFDFKGNQFAGFTYLSKGTGELARHVVQVGISYENLLQKDIETLSNLLPHFSGIGLQAAESVLKSLNQSLECLQGKKVNPDYTCAGIYEQTEFAGVKKHKETGEFFVSGLANFKEVIQPGTPKKPIKSRPLTIAKREIEKELRKSKWRQFSLSPSQIKGLRVNGKVVE